MNGRGLGLEPRGAECARLGQMGGDRILEAQRADDAAGPATRAADRAVRVFRAGIGRELDGLREIEFAIAIVVRASEAEEGARRRVQYRHLWRRQTRGRLDEIEVELQRRELREARAHDGSSGA